MEFVGDNKDSNKLINVKGNVENITPHKVAVVAFIREYGILKMEVKDMIDCSMAPKYRKDFCILALKLIQCPDMEFKDLEALLTDGRYNLLSVHLQNFCVRLQNIYDKGISALIDCITSTFDKLMIEQSETNSCVITRFSVLGFYLRRIMVNLEKLTFVQVVALYKSFCQYYQRGRPGLMMRSLSKEKLNNVEASSSQSPLPPEQGKPHELSLRLNMIDRDHCFEECQWSRKQAELFTAQQASLLQINDKKAHPSKQLQKTINQIINDNPDYPDIHFLSFMNCIRMKEFCGAQDSLYNCFDRAIFTSSNAGADKNKSYRYAALNRAAMHTHFGHKEMGVESAAEAVRAAQEAGDANMVAQAAGWAALAGAGPGAGAAPGPAHPRPSPMVSRRFARAPRAAASAAQHLAQRTAVTATLPAYVFQIITKGDSLNYLHSMTDLTMAGLANTASLWSLYGNAEMASLGCQLLLNLRSEEGSGQGGARQCAGAGLARVLGWRGEGLRRAALASALQLRRGELARDDAFAHLLAAKWDEAEQCIQQLASCDRWESQLLKGQMFFWKGNCTDAVEAVRDVLECCRTEEDSLFYMSLRVKALLLMSQVQHAFNKIQSSNIMHLNEALSLAKKHHLHYLAAMAEMHIANVQLHMGCAKKALTLLRKVLPTIMAHGSTFDMGRALAVFAMCRVACAAGGGAARARAAAAAEAALLRARELFLKVNAHAHLLHCCYLQAQLYNETGNVAARNQCACMYRQLEAQNPIEPSTMLLVMY